MKFLLTDMASAESSCNLIYFYQLLVAAGGKISNKSRNSYDQHLVKYVRC